MERIIISKIILASHGEPIFVDSFWYSYLIQFKWAFHNGYPVRYEAHPTQLRTTNCVKNGKLYWTPFRRRIYMHKEIFGAIFNEYEIDHRNRKRNDCRRYNLRVVPSFSYCQNANKDIQKNNTSGYRGVILVKGRWRARIGIGRKRLHIGYFTKKEDAHIAYVDAAKKYFGEYAVVH